MEKKGGEKMGMSCAKLLKTHTAKMPAFRLSTMLMKINELYVAFHYIYEKKAS